MAGIENFQACLTAISDALGREAKEDEVDRIFRGVQGRVGRYERGGMDPLTAARQAGADMAAEMKAASAIETRNKLMNLAKRVQRRARLQESAATIGGDGEPDLALAVRNQVVAINTPTQGGRMSAEATWKTRSKEYVAGVVTALEKAGLLRAASDPVMERKWAREMYETSMRDAGMPAQPGVTGDAQAQQIAGIFSKFQALARSRLNREGAWIGDYAGYITRTSHDPDAIRRAGFEAWRDAIGKGLDERTFDGVEDREAYLRDTWHALVTGVHMSDGTGVGFRDPAFTGPGNAAAKLSESRVLHFKDAEAWLDYQHRFGTGSVLENTLNSFDRAARQEALMSRFGTNPQAEFTQDIQWLRQQFRDSNPDAVIALGKAEHGLQTRMGFLTGEATRPVNRVFAQISSGVRTIESMAKLGMVAFTHLSAGVTKAAELRYQGVGVFDRYSNFISSIFQGRGRGDYRDLADLLLSGTEGMHGHLLARFSPDDTVPGTLSKAANSFFKATGLTYLLDAQKAGAERIMSRHLGSLVDRDFASLPAETRRGLMQYDISPDEWDRLRTAPDHPAIDGRVFLTPDAATRQAMRMPGPLTPAADAAQDALAQRLHAYISDVAHRSIVTPGIETRALMVGNNRPGTALGEALRFVAQFKTWGVAAVQQGIGREVYGGQGAAGAISGIMQMAIGASVLGYATMTLKDLFKGLTPRSPTDPKTYMAALIQGGGFGILGDYLFGEYSRFGGGIGESLLGPVLGQGLTEVMNVWNEAKAGKIKDIPPELMRIGMSNTPFINMFYTRIALNYLLLHSLQETMSPGYLRRSEQRVRQQNGQSYWLSPTANHLRTFGR
jgi:hypothetical protein